MDLVFKEEAPLASKSVLSGYSGRSFVLSYLRIFYSVDLFQWNQNDLLFSARGLWFMQLVQRSRSNRNNLWMPLMMREVCMLPETARSRSKAVAEADRCWAEPLDEKQKGREREWEYRGLVGSGRPSVRQSLWGHTQVQFVTKLRSICIQ